MVFPRAVRILRMTLDSGINDLLDPDYLAYMLKTTPCTPLLKATVGDGTK